MFTGILLFIVGIPLSDDILAQPVPDSLISLYDSIQDVHRKRWERGMESRLHGLDISVQNNTASADSARRVLQELQESISELRYLQRIQEQQLDSVAARLEKASQSAAVYRKNLRRNLWISGGLFLLLLAASFTYLLVRSVKTRKMLQRIRLRRRRDRRKLEGRIAQQEEILMTAIGSQERRFRKRLKALKKRRSGEK
jgi:hypothetical protein